MRLHGDRSAALGALVNVISFGFMNDSLLEPAMIARISKYTHWRHTVRRAVSRIILAFFMLGGAVACAADSPTITQPAQFPPPIPAPTPAPAPVFPAPTHSATIYDRVTASSIPGASRYVVYDDSTFSLQYLSPRFGFFEYRGTYSRADSMVTLRFDANSNAWFASAILKGRSLIVKYNLDMQLSDFEDGLYESAAPVTNGEHIYLADADGLAITQLAVGDWPAWSPDGQHLAYQRNGQIYVIETNGSNERWIAVGTYPAWSPDGRRIAFTNSAGVAVMNADGSGVTTLIRHDFRTDTDSSSDMGVGKPAWSPDGTRIAFEHLGDGNIQPAQIFVMNADGTQPRRLTTSPNRVVYAESDPSWSPDGSKIVFWSYGYGIATAAANGGAPSSIYINFPAVAYGTKPTWSPDGINLVFTMGRLSTAPAIWTVPAGGGVARLLISGGYDAAWSPSGERIAFVRTSGK